MRWVAVLLLIVNLGLGAWIAAGSPGGPRTEATPPEEIGELRLLSEVDSPPQAGAGGTGAGAAEAGGGTTTACFTVGPFTSAERAEAARARLAELGLEPEQRTTEDEEVYGYQVVLPPRDTREDAIAATRELARKGIKDYFVIVQDTELENAVSVGLFREKRYAVRHTEYLEELGFDPEMHLRTRSQTRYWQDYRDPDGVVTPELLESLAADQPLQRLERACE